MEAFLVHLKGWKLERENQMRYLQIEMQKSLWQQIVSITEGSKNSMEKNRFVIKSVL